MKKFFKSLIIIFVITSSAIAGSDGENELSKKKVEQIKDCFEPLNTNNITK